MTTKHGPRTSNPTGSPSVTGVTVKGGSGEADRFESLTRRLVRVPKSEITDEGERADR